MFRKKERKVDFLIIGAQKCGTTSLHYYLSQHPNLITSYSKEVDYFSYDGLYKKGNDWYHDQFPKKSSYLKKELLFEASPDYLYLPYVAERIYKYNPKMKLIVLTRDPIDRAISAYTMYKQLNQGNLWIKDYLKHLENHTIEFRDTMKSFLCQKEFPSFEKIIDIELQQISKTNYFTYEPSFIRRGEYSKQILRYYNYFESNQILVIENKKLEEKTLNTLNSIAHFLNIPKFKYTNINLEKKLKQTNKYQPSIETISKLSNYYKNRDN